MDWRHTAACLDEDPELFYPIGNTGPAILQIAEAKAVCRRCDVVETCLRWALESLDNGVAGGMSEDERRSLRRHQARSARAVRRSAGEEVPRTTGVRADLVDPPDAVRAELLRRREAGVTLNRLRKITGVNTDTLSAVCAGERDGVPVQVLPSTLERLERGLGLVLA